MEKLLGKSLFWKNGVVRFVKFLFNQKLETLSIVLVNVVIKLSAKKMLANTESVLRNGTQITKSELKNKEKSITTLIQKDLKRHQETTGLLIHKSMNILTENTKIKQDTVESVKSSLLNLAWSVLNVAKKAQGMIFLHTIQALTTLSTKVKFYYAGVVTEKHTLNQWQTLILFAKNVELSSRLNPRRLGIVLKNVKGRLNINVIQKQIKNKLKDGKQTTETGLMLIKENIMPIILKNVEKKEGFTDKEKNNVWRINYDRIFTF